VRASDAGDNVLALGHVEDGGNGEPDPHKWRVPIPLEIFRLQGKPQGGQILGHSGLVVVDLGEEELVVVGLNGILKRRSEDDLMGGVYGHPGGLDEVDRWVAWLIGEVDVFVFKRYEDVELECLGCSILVLGSEIEPDVHLGGMGWQKALSPVPVVDGAAEAKSSECCQVSVVDDDLARIGVLGLELGDLAKQVLDAVLADEALDHFVCGS